VSYCRFSSDSWRCEVYCYEDCSGGFTTHVAGNRIVGDVPQDLPWPSKVMSESEVEQWMVRHNEQMAFLDTCERKPIGLPHDGDSFNDPDEESMLARLIGLQALGYHVPQYVIDGLKEDIAASKKDAR